MTTARTFIAFLSLCAWPGFPSAQGGTNPVQGAEFAAAADLIEKNIKAEATIFLPQRVARVRAVIVTAGRAPLVNRSAEPFYLWRTLSETSECAVLYLRLATIRPDSQAGDAFIRDAAAGGADALFAILQRLGDQSAHPELKDAPLLLWGGSAGAGFGRLLRNCIHSVPSPSFDIMRTCAAGRRR